MRYLSTTCTFATSCILCYHLSLCYCSIICICATSCILCYHLHMCYVNPVCVSAIWAPSTHVPPVAYWATMRPCTIWTPSAHVLPLHMHRCCSNGTCTNGASEDGYHIAHMQMVAHVLSSAYCATIHTQSILSLHWTIQLNEIMELCCNKSCSVLPYCPCLVEHSNAFIYWNLIQLSTTTVPIYMEIVSVYGIYTIC